MFLTGLFATHISSIILIAVYVIGYMSYSHSNKTEATCAVQNKTVEYSTIENATSNSETNTAFFVNELFSSHIEMVVQPALKFKHCTIHKQHIAYQSEFFYTFTLTNLLFLRPPPVNSFC